MTPTILRISECAQLLGNRYSACRSLLLENIGDPVQPDQGKPMVAPAWVLSAQEDLRKEVGVATQVISDPELLAADAVMLKSVDGSGADNSTVWLVIQDDAGDQDALVVALARDMQANPKKYASTDLSAHATVSPELETKVKEKYPDVADKLLGDDVVGKMRGMGIPDKSIVSSKGISVDMLGAAKDVYAQMGRKEVLEMLGYNTFAQLSNAVAYGKR